MNEFLLPETDTYPEIAQIDQLASADPETIFMVSEQLQNDLLKQKEIGRAEQVMCHAARVAAQNSTKLVPVELIFLQAA